MRGRRKSDETRAAILRCASEVFSERPFHEVLIDDITARMGIGKGTLYRYFNSKEELYFATIVDGMHGLGEAIEAVLQRNNPLETTIEELIRTVIGYFWERRDFFVLFHRQEPKLDPHERKEWQDRREEAVVMIAAKLAKEIRLRRITGIDPRMAVEMLFGMIRSVCMYRDQRHNAEDLAGLIAKVFFHGVLTTAEIRPRQIGTGRARLNAVRGGKQ